MLEYAIFEILIKEKTRSYYEQAFLRVKLLLRIYTSLKVKYPY